MTSYPEYFFGNIFETDSLARMLKESTARRQFVERPAAIIPHDCIQCDYLSLCHGGCPVRTYTFTGTMLEKDPYCHAYLAMFRKAEEVAARLAGDRARYGSARRVATVNGCCGASALAKDTIQEPLPISPSLFPGSKLVQIERMRL